MVRIPGFHFCCGPGSIPARGTEITLALQSYLKKKKEKTSLAAWWLRYHAPMQGAWVQSLVGNEDPSCRVAPPENKTKNNNFTVSCTLLGLASLPQQKDMRFEIYPPCWVVSAACSLPMLKNIHPSPGGTTDYYLFTCWRTFGLFPVLGG